MMKKLTAILLALCLLLAAVPALGEDFSGTWYMVLAEVTAGQFDLNADGTATAQMPGQEETFTGSWTADDASVTITIDGSPLTFAWDGEKLFSDKLPIPVVREAGRVPMDLIQKYMGGEEYELPEGMDEAELLSIMVNFAAETQALSGSVGSDETPAEPAAEPASEPAAEPAAEPAGEAKLDVVGEKFFVAESYNGFRAYYTVKLQNNTSAPVYLKGCNLIVTDAEGNTVAEEKYFASTGSKYVEPGEVTIACTNTDVPENAEYTYAANLEFDSDPYSIDVNLEAADPVYVPEHDYESSCMKATVANGTDAPMSRIHVAYALEDAEGNIYLVKDESIYNHELGANSSITLVTSVDDRVEKYCEANGIALTQVEAFAWKEIN